MNGKSRALRTGEYLVGRAAGYLPPSDREERHQEWAAELPAILNDPTVRPAARRAARMLWFALDTLRGAAVARYTSRGHHAHRDADGKARDRVTRDGLASLFTLLVLLGLGVVLFYPGLFGGLAYDVAFLLIPLIIILSTVVDHEPMSLRSHWNVWSLLVWGTGQFLHGLAHHLGWGHPLLFTVILYGSGAVFVAALGIALFGWVRSTRADFRNVRP